MTDDLEWLAMRLAFLGCDFDAETPPERSVPRDQLYPALTS
jgi:hypothetical protein